MIKIMKLQKAVIAILLGALLLVAYFIMSAKDISWSHYMLEVSGVLLMLGGLLFIYPIVFARKDKEGCVELDPEVVIEQPADKTEL